MELPPCDLAPICCPAKAGDAQHTGVTLEPGRQTVPFGHMKAESRFLFQQLANHRKQEVEVGSVDDAAEEGSLDPALTLLKRIEMTEPGESFGPERAQQMRLHHRAEQACQRR